MAEPGWHPDPSGAASWRWWDGTRWTDRTAPAQPDPDLLPLASALGRTLELPREQGHGQDHVDLRDEAGHYAHFSRDPGGATTVQAHEGTWSFLTQGFTQRNVAVYVEPARAQVAQFSWSGLGGVSGTEGGLVLGDGRNFPFLKTKEVNAGPGGNWLDQLAALASASWTFVDPRSGPVVTSAYERDRVIRTRLEPAAAVVTGMQMLVLTATYLAWSALEAQEAHERARRHRRQHDW